MAQIRQVVSESLQATIRRLLPSQQGFTEDLQATNVIQPIIDLTPTAEGSELSTPLQQAISFTDATQINVSNDSFTAANTAGFWRIMGSVRLNGTGSTDPFTNISINNGLSSKIIWGHTAGDGATQGTAGVGFDFIVFLTAGDSLVVQASGNEGFIVGSVRQVADVNGNLKNPTGFVSQ